MILDQTSHSKDKDKQENELTVYLNLPDGNQVSNKNKFQSDVLIKIISELSDYQRSLRDAINSDVYKYLILLLTAFYGLLIFFYVGLEALTPKSTSDPLEAQLGYFELSILVIYVIDIMVSIYAFTFQVNSAQKDLLPRPLEHNGSDDNYCKYWNSA